MIDIKIFTKDELINQLRNIEARGWIENTRRKNNDGAAGNLLEDLLGIPENNLPIPNAAEWELKTKRKLDSLLTLFHQEPSPQAVQVVNSYLLPTFGWKHKQAGQRYPLETKSFRATLKAGRFTRGFTISVNDVERKIEVQFKPSQVDSKDFSWLSSLNLSENPDSLKIQPYWGIDDLFGKAQTKLHNCFLVLAESKKSNKKLFFHFYRVWMLKDLNSNLFLDAIRKGKMCIDFDARTGHNHGTKFRIALSDFIDLYGSVTKLIDHSLLSES